MKRLSAAERKRRVKAAAMRHFRATHPDYMREYMQARRAADPDEHREQAHEYYIENRDEILAAARQKRATAARTRRAASGRVEAPPLKPPPIARPPAKVRGRIRRPLPDNRL